MEGYGNKVFSSQAMSHCHKLRYRAFGASPLKPFFVSLFLFISQYQKGDFITKHEQFIQITNHFLNKSHIAINLLACLPCWPSHSPDICLIKATSFSNILHFPEKQLYCQYAVKNAFVLDILNVIFYFVIFYIHLICTYHVRPTPVLSICLFFFNLSLFLRFKFTWHVSIMTMC